jgi:NADPH:quinone reductase-like Zn-dependent oxidoreductase
LTRCNIPVPESQRKCFKQLVEPAEIFRGLIEVGKYRAVIDRRYPLEEVVEATRYVETKQKTGNVVLTVSDDHGT